MLSGITNWLLSIVGVVLIGVLVDIILPDGQMQKYIKVVFSVFVVFVMIYPIVNINLNKIDFNKFLYNSTSVELNENYLKNYNLEYKNSLEKLTENQLSNNGFMGVDVEININLDKTNFNIEKVILNAKNLVINTNTVHIDKYKEIKGLVANFLYIEEERVVINEWK